VNGDAGDPAALAAEEPPPALRIAFVGKPNAGKSSLVNRLLGAERSLVHDQPGTTTDPVDTPFDLGGRRYVLVDTAGIRRRPRVEPGMEQIAVSLALAQIRRADVAVLVVDATLGASEQDARIAGGIAERGSAVVVALNKCDRMDPASWARVTAEVRHELHFLDHAPKVMVSAQRGDGVVDLLARVDDVAREHVRRVPTAELNRFFAEVCETHPPPMQSGKSVHIHYLTQGGVKPPTFLLFANRPKLVTTAYRRFLANQLRARYGFLGTPVRVVVKPRKSPTAR
jgi:GTP-binding protein